MIRGGETTKLVDFKFTKQNRSKRLCHGEIGRTLIEASEQEESRVGSPPY